MQGNKQQKIKSPIGAYIGYLFQTFLKRPFGYIVAVLYILYLAIILLIVPASLHFEPLFIWNIGGFNMPIFNLFFIAGSAASIAVAVFRTGRDDGFDLNMSAKPFTKGTTVILKTIVYLLIMLIVNIITLLIVLLIYPVFGELDPINNMTGIKFEKYIGLILSIFIGNLVNMLFFGAISVFISIVGGQVITIIGSISIVFIMCLMNFLYPQILKTSTDILSEKYDTEILSYSCNTLEQYNNQAQDSAPLNFAAMQCVTNDFGEEEIHYDTKEYWDKAEREAGRKLANYVDVGKQLSSLYSIFGLDESRLKEASKLVIGTNNAYNYHIAESSHVALTENTDAGKYPIGIYDMSTSQGKSYPYVRVVGGNMTINTSNWYLLSTLWQLNFDSVAYLSTEEDAINVPDKLWSKYKTPWNFMSDLYMNEQQRNASKALYENARDTWDAQNKEQFSTFTHDIIAGDTSEQFFEVGKFDQLSSQDKHLVITKNHLYWATLAQQDQIDAIYNWAITQPDIGEVKFPFTSKVVGNWYENKVDPQDEPYHNKNDFNLRLFTRSIKVEHFDDGNYDAYSRLVTSGMKYAETYTNLYTYSVSNFYNMSVIIAIWTTISIALFAGSILVYKKTDFK